MIARDTYRRTTDIIMEFAWFTGKRLHSLRVMFFVLICTIVRYSHDTTVRTGSKRYCAVYTRGLVLCE